jgi:hypothetical protein
MRNIGCNVLFRPPSRSMSPARIVRRLVIYKGWLSVLIAALVAAVFLTACGPSSSNDPSLPSGTDSTGLYTPTADPYAPSDETTADPYAPSDETTADPYAPSDETNHCAYAGDPLCPDTPITVPPPNLSAPY